MPSIKTQLLSDVIYSLNFLFSGAVNVANLSNNPSVIPQGLEITQGKYVVVSNKWAGSGSRTSLDMWFFHISGTMGRFIDVRVDVSYGVS